MKEGFTTGSCATAATLASCLWQATGVCPQQVDVIVPEGRHYIASIVEHEAYRCGVYKDAGDDPDITNESEVCAQVKLYAQQGDITFHAGEGVGIVTRRGLKVPEGEPAINPIPRQMMIQALRSVFPTERAEITVSIVGGEELAKRTFNPRLGIQGGLSILGTSGIVRPMSEDAIKDTIALELQMKRQYTSEVALVFGQQGENMLQRYAPEIHAVQMSNYVGFALDECVKLGYEKVILAGHIGKMCKVSAGVMQTHSQYGDVRREAIITQLALVGAERSLCEKVYTCVTTDAILEVIADCQTEVLHRLAISAKQYAQARTFHKLTIEVYLFNTAGEMIGQSE